jgi:hypothetical protein
MFDLLQLRRERIAERMRALQELVPNTNKVLMLHTCRCYYIGEDSTV